MNTKKYFRQWENHQKKLFDRSRYFSWEIRSISFLSLYYHTNRWPSRRICQHFRTKYIENWWCCHGKWKALKKAKTSSFFEKPNFLKLHVNFPWVHLKKTYEYFLLLYIFMNIRFLREFQQRTRNLILVWSSS